MQINNNTPFKLIELEQRTYPTGWEKTFIVKGTFTLPHNGVSEISDSQREICGDQKYMDEIGRSPSWASDLAPHKPHSDFFIFGHFYQKDGIAGPQGKASFEFGPLKKELAFFGPRYAVQNTSGSWKFTTPEAMVSVPLRWEYSFGGLSDRRNPMGLGLELASRGGIRAIALPLIEDPHHLIARMGDRPAPANFAPVPLNFSPRREKLGTRDKRWQTFRAPIPPEDFDPSYHNAAPSDQQAGNYPRGDEKLVLNNLHCANSNIVTYLPGIRPCMGLIRQIDDVLSAESVHLNLDTVVALPDENQIVLIWRGKVCICDHKDPNEFVLLQCEFESINEPSKFADLPNQMLIKYEQVIQNKIDRNTSHEEKTIAEIKENIKKLPLPASTIDELSAESDPEKLLVNLERHLDSFLMEIQNRFGIK